jgi:hypothetical protein
MDGSGPQIIVVQAPRLRRSYESYAGTAVMILGLVQIFNGLGSLGLGIANPLTCGVYGMIGDGIWWRAVHYRWCDGSCFIQKEIILHGEHAPGDVPGECRGGHY